MKNLNKIIAASSLALGMVAVASTASANTYTIQSGDTLSFIALNLGVDMNKLAQDNNIADVNWIYAGETLNYDEANLGAEPQAQAPVAEAQRFETPAPVVEAPAPTPQPEVTPTPSGGLEFDGNGLLVESPTGNAQAVINGLLGIPGHSNGQSYHANGLDALIDTLTTPEAIYVIHRIEGAGFGQTGAGYAGYDTPASHQAFVNQQVNGRFGGSVHALLKAWGTFSYGGY